MKRRQFTRSPVYLEAPSSFHAGREILAPASLDKFGDVGAHDKLVGVARLHARINDEGRAVRDVLTAHVGLGGVDVCGWLEARPRRPQEINRRARDRRVVVEDDEGPVLEDFFTREARCLLWVFREGGTLNDEAAGAEDFGARDARGKRAFKLARQFAHGVAESEQDGFASAVDRAARVVERVHRDVREDEEVAFGPEAREDVLEEYGEVSEVLRRVGEDEELREREVALAEYAEGRDERLARVALAHDRRAARVESGLAVSPEVAHARHDEWEERREKVLQGVADEEAFLPRLS